MVGTSAESGKTTAGLSVLDSLLHHGQSTVVALKATGTASVRELMTYRDFGAVEAFDFVDLRLPAYVDLITGPCTDTPTTLERTRTLCRVTAFNMTRRGTPDVL